MKLAIIYNQVILNSVNNLLKISIAYHLLHRANIAHSIQLRIRATQVRAIAINTAFPYSGRRGRRALDCSANRSA